MSGQHARPHGLFDSKDAERLATPEERSAMLPARRLPGFLRWLSPAKLWRKTSGWVATWRQGGRPGNSWAGSPILLPATPLSPLPPVDIDEPPRAIPQVAAMRVSIWLPPAEQLVDEDLAEQLVDDLAELRRSLCSCGEKWGPCLLAEVAEILHHPLVDLAVDSITMAAVR